MPFKCKAYYFKECMLIMF
jgi:calcium/calmodulin-dependent protein kinase I